MSGELKSTESAQPVAGSSVNDLGNAGPFANAGGEPARQTANLSSSELEELKQKYEKAAATNKELETKLGTQGAELGDLRNFFEGIGPMLQALEDNPKLARALYDGTIDSSTVEAILGGKATVQDAKVVTEAHTQVRKEMGRAAYEKAAPEEIEEKVRKLTEVQLKEALDKQKKEILATIDSEAQKRDFQEYIDKFIATTPDFAEHAVAVTRWLDENPSIWDIKVAYNAVKSASILEEKKQGDLVAAAEAQKKIAQNAGGGAARATEIVTSREAIDQLIAPRTNPNNLL